MTENRPIAEEMHLPPPSYKRARKLTPAGLVEAAKTASVVGTVLMLINQFEAFEGTMTINVTKAVLSYCVPFCVYLYGSLKVRD